MNVGCWSTTKCLFVILYLAWQIGVQAQQPTELLVRNGLIVTSEGRSEGDIRVRNGVIVEIGENLTGNATAREIDATGLLVFPGGVDPHSHIFGAEDFTSASAAALAGGG